MRAIRKLRGLRRRIRNRGRPIILMYHRVANVACDPWHLAVPPDRFADQIEALVQERQVVPLRWLASRLAEGRVPRKTAVVTFDDGYVDVLVNAKPILERHACPATVFLTTGAIGRGEEFWWDELSRIVLESPAVPSELQLELGLAYRWRLADASRAELHVALWRLLLPLDPAQRRDALDFLSDWAGVERRPHAESRALDADEVNRLSSPGFIDIGAHTVSHPSLPLLDPPTRRAELQDSRRVCAELTGTEIDAFAYPFGSFDDASTDDVRDAGFRIACTTERACVHERSDPLRLPRITVGDWDAAGLLRSVEGSAR